jgi:glycosyltransferase involved in cell wall biosynthesis
MMFEHVDKCRKAIDRITILVPGTPQPFDDSSTDNMLGGSEEAVVYLTRALAALGRNVRVYGILPPTSWPGMSASGVEYRPFDEFNLRDEHGTLVIWRAVGLLDQLLGERASVFERMQRGDEAAIEPTGIGRSSLWLHDMSTGVKDPQICNAILSAVDSVIVLSDHHRKCIERELPENHTVRFVTLSNGIQPEDFCPTSPEVFRDPNRVMYSSCPSRGLEVLLDAWPVVKQECPDAYLDIYYDWSGVKNHDPAMYARLLKRLDELAPLNVKHHGGVGHAELRRAFQGSNVWAYSHFRNTDVETFAISAVKATAAGCSVLTGLNGALPEVVPDAFFASEAGYTTSLIDMIQNPEGVSLRYAQAKDAADRFSWPRVAERFSAEWTTHRAPRT